MGNPFGPLVDAAVKSIQAENRQTAASIAKNNQKSLDAATNLQFYTSFRDFVLKEHESYDKDYDLYIKQKVAYEAGVIDDDYLQLFDIDSSTIDLSKKVKGRLWAQAVAAAEQINQQRLAAAKEQQALEQRELDRQYNDAVQRVEAEAKAFEEAAAKRRLDSGLSAIDEFFDPSKNSIVRSFRSAGGRGLAGFIESMNFEWLDNQYIMWETEKHQAPMLCKVTIQFSPVHDISPGLDSQGYNRAPVYPVGHFANSNTEKDAGPED